MSRAVGGFDVLSGGGLRTSFARTVNGVDGLVRAGQRQMHCSRR